MPRVEGELPGNQPYLIHNNGDMKVCFINNIVVCSLTSILRLDDENELSINLDFIGLDNYNNHHYHYHFHNHHCSNI